MPGGYAPLLQRAVPTATEAAYWFTNTHPVVGRVIVPVARIRYPQTRQWTLRHSLYAIVTGLYRT